MVRTNAVSASLAHTVAGLALLSSLGSCGGPQPTPPPAPATASEAPAARAALVSGPMLGYAAHREVAVWVQATEPAAVQVRYWPAEEPDAARFTAPQLASASADRTATIPVTGLEPGTAYTYEIWLDGAAQERPYAQSFETQPLWQWRTDPPAFEVAIGSCMYANEEAYDRPGTPYGADHHIFDTILAEDPDLMLWLGDNTYLREVDWGAPGAMSLRYEHDRALPELQPLLASVHHYATWDDHDYGPNDADRSYVFRDVSLELFSRYWANPTYGRPEAPGVYTRFTWGDVEFFLLDDRYHRAPNDDPDPGRPMLGDVQLQWLIDGLTSSNATFKVVANGGQMLNPNTPYESYMAFPEERQRLLDAIAARQIEGVLMLSGDRHHTELIRIDREGAYPLYEFTSSPLTSGVGDARYELDNPVRVDGTLVRERNFGLLRFEGPRDARTVTLEARSVDGAVLWSHTLSESELR